MPDKPEPYDPSQPFDADTLMDGFELVDDDVGAPDAPCWKRWLGAVYG